MKKVFNILFVFITVFALAACGNKSENNSDKKTNTSNNEDKSTKTFAFPDSEFVPDWAEYTGEGEYVFTEMENTNLEERAICTYIDGATLDDVKNYINMLKENGMTYAGYSEESLEPNNVGYVSWYAVNNDKSFSISINFSSEKEEINDILYNTGTHNYNVQIQVGNNDYMN